MYGFLIVGAVIVLVWLAKLSWIAIPVVFAIWLFFLVPTEGRRMRREHARERRLERRNQRVVAQHFHDLTHKHD